MIILVLQLVAITLIAATIFLALVTAGVRVAEKNLKKKDKEK